MEVLDYSIFPEKPVVYASFWNRFAAVFIDGLILLLPSLVINYLFRDYPLAPLLPNIIIGWLYDALQESGPNMATIGKKAMRIKVTDLAGNRITFGQATGRHFGKILSTIILFFGYFMMLWDPKSQTLHDKIAGTVVIVVKPDFSWLSKIGISNIKK